MPISLSKEHRKLLEKTTAVARIKAESACKAALENLAVHEREYRSHMNVDQRLLRNRLRARGRAIGDARDSRTGQSIQHLTELAAYEHWHRLLFTRFLTENNLLITDEANGSVPVTLEECEELAPELGARDGLDLACRFASLTLPGVFRRDDPVLDLQLALNDQVELRKLLADLPSECFRADDALGWTYQFWQAQRKEEVNKSGKKIGADELSPVTQLFTEDYMVEFLLHNTLGAWWAGKLGPMIAATEQEARAQAALSARDGVPAISWTYLRFVQDEATGTWSPAAGTFDGWPKNASLIRLLDPCMGSGHFLVFALPILVRLRMEEEQLSAEAAVVAVLQDNIHGLELDERCTQIAAFNVALTAWKIAGYQSLPSLHLACSGLAPSATEAEWMALAGDDERVRNGMERLYRLFQNAPVLGSLINPRVGKGDMFEAAFHELQPLLEKALAQETKDDTTHEMAVIARGLAKAAEILASQFTLVATNVPYLGRGKQNDVLADYCEMVYPEAKADLATCFVERCRSFCSRGGYTSLVTPQNWLFLSTYRLMRKRLLGDATVVLVVELGAGAFQTPLYDFSFALFIATNSIPAMDYHYTALVASEFRAIDSKIDAMNRAPCVEIGIKSVRSHADSRILTQPSLGNTVPLSTLTIPNTGMQTGDNDLFCHPFWELPMLLEGWEFFQRTTQKTQHFGGRELVLLYEGGNGKLREFAASQDRDRRRDMQGVNAWGKRGVLVHRMGDLPSTIFTGEMFDQNGAALIPVEDEYLAAIWCFISSDIYKGEVRKLDNKVGVTPMTLAKVPFDLAYWQKVAAEKYPHGLPTPFSSDPTQWLFNGHPAGADQLLHVAVARLLGYQWPRQTGSSFPDCPALASDGLEKLSDHDGIVCLPPINREQPAAARLRELLTAALGTFDERALIASAGPKGSKSKTLEDCLRDEFFEQHCALFHHRPFIWHIWDGRSDGFHALINYHKLDNATLQKLTYSYLGDWIRKQSDDAKADKPGAAERLGAAQKLQSKLAKILEGEEPHDIFVRWKPLAQQAIGWHPDLNDGVRLNIRPFMLTQDVGKKDAGLLRSKPNIKWDKDRGKEPYRKKEEYPWFWYEEEPGTDPVGEQDFTGNRWNNVHLTLKKKKEARA